MSQDSDDFSSQMQQTGVKPLTRRSNRLLPELSTRHARDPNAAQRRKAAMEVPGSALDLNSNDPGYHAGIEWLGAFDLVEYKRHGIQNEVFKRLKQGNYDIGARLDLHEYRIDEARVALFRFLADCTEHDIRCALVIHGKGYHSRQDDDLPASKPISKLKSHTIHWLKGHAAVQAACSARPADGGAGAVYVLLRKSERAKERNREIYRGDKA